MNCRSERLNSEMMGRNVPAFQETPTGGVRDFSPSGKVTPSPGTPERNAISKDIGTKRSGGRYQGQPKRPPERFVSTVPAHSGPTSALYLGSEVG